MSDVMHRSSVVRIDAPSVYGVCIYSYMYCTEIENCTERQCKNSVCPRMHHSTGNSTRYQVVCTKLKDGFLILRILYTCTNGVLVLVLHYILIVLLVVYYSLDKSPVLLYVPGTVQYTNKYDTYQVQFKYYY
jgi:hypothetical protein